MKYLMKNRFGKAQYYFLLTVFINLALFSAIVTGIVTGIQGYISDTTSAYEAVTCCGSICSACFFTLHTLVTALPWLCIAIFFIGIGMATYKVLLMLSGNYRVIRSLAPLSIKNHPELKTILLSVHLHHELVLFDNSVLRYAFTSGFWKPRIYVSTGICSSLSAKELRSVILHETHHILQRAPFMLFIIRLLCVLNFFLPINRYLFNLYSSASEKEADDAAVRISTEPLELASALLKLSRSPLPPAVYSMMSFFQEQGLVEERIMRLLEPDAAPPRSVKTALYQRCLLSFFISVTICLSLYGKGYTFFEQISCKTKVCHMVQCG